MCGAAALLLHQRGASAWRVAANISKMADVEEHDMADSLTVHEVWSLHYLRSNGEELFAMQPSQQDDSNFV